MRTNLDALKLRFASLQNSLANVGFSGNPGDPNGPSSERTAFYAWAVRAHSAIRTAFGERSPHCRAFEAQLESVRDAPVYMPRLHAILGIFTAAKEDVDDGYLYDVEQAVTGEVVGDFVAFAKTALAEGHHTVACVLASAALEDALKRYAVDSSAQLSQ